MRPNVRVSGAAGLHCVACDRRRSLKNSRDRATAKRERTGSTRQPVVQRPFRGAETRAELARQQLGKRRKVFLLPEQYRTHYACRECGGVEMRAHLDKTGRARLDCTACSSKEAREYHKAQMSKDPHFGRKRSDILRARNPLLDLVRHARQRSGITQQVERLDPSIPRLVRPEELSLPTHCPLCGQRVTPRVGMGHHRDTPTLDRIDPKGGYAPDNVWIICRRCNSVKSDGAPEDLLRIIEGIKRVKSGEYDPKPVQFDATKDKQKTRQLGGRHHRRRLWWAAQKRARDKGLRFTIGPEDVVVPATCPWLGVALTLGAGRQAGHSPTLDRLDPERGYTPDNIIVVCDRANRMKQDATLAELETIHRNWVALLESRRQATGGKGAQ